jgi:hypothetical protein
VWLVGCADQPHPKPHSVKLLCEKREYHFKAILKEEKTRFGWKRQSLTHPNREHLIIFRIRLFHRWIMGRKRK